ncbi:hypothetical protein Q8A64_17780 [Oxalobacteraceae bacterium R-40]|uniref:Uncharacterized protein n=1 Tax=Keguizhuia sedimenti TaxID=3064264 RepID=A0ABU1BVZ2_9BURK|nr:hypothetical protein [Oxalobacteraceae bacterium R-40]
MSFSLGDSNQPADECALSIQLFASNVGASLFLWGKRVNQLFQALSVYREYKNGLNYD